MTVLEHIRKIAWMPRPLGRGKNRKLFGPTILSYGMFLPLSTGGGPRAVTHQEPPQKSVKKNQCSSRKNLLSVRYVSCPLCREGGERSFINVCNVTSSTSSTPGGQCLIRSPTTYQPICPRFDSSTQSPSTKY